MSNRTMGDAVVTKVVTNGTVYVAPDGHTTQYIYQAATYEDEEAARKEAERRGDNWRISEMVVF